MTDISAFPTITNVVYSGNNFISLTATTAVTAGQLVAINATGVSMAVDKCVAAAGSMPIGVAVFSAAAGALVDVAGPGCIVYMANADDTTAIDAGSWVEFNDNTVGGTISAVAVSATGGATVTCHFGVVGVAMDDIDASGTGRVLLVGPQCVVQANSS